MTSKFGLIVHEKLGFQEVLKETESVLVGCGKIIG